MSQSPKVWLIHWDPFLSYYSYRLHFAYLIYCIFFCLHAGLWNVNVSFLKHTVLCKSLVISWKNKKKVQWFVKMYKHFLKMQFMRLKLMAVDAHSLHTSSVHIDNSLNRHFSYLTSSLHQTCWSDHWFSVLFLRNLVYLSLFSLFHFFQNDFSTATFPLRSFSSVIFFFHYMYP